MPANAAKFGFDFCAPRMRRVETPAARHTDPASSHLAADHSTGTGNLFEEQEEAKALQAHRDAWRCCWGWPGPEIGGYCSVDSCCAEKEDGGMLYCHTEECRLIERRADGKWLAVIEMGEVNGKPWRKDGTRLVLGEFDIWPPVRRLKAARASNGQGNRSEPA